MLEDQDWVYRYDAEGNVVEKKSKGTGVTWSYTFDHANRLTRVEERTKGGILLRSVSYVYDLLNRRIARTAFAKYDKQFNADERFAYDGANVWADLDDKNKLRVRYLRGDLTDQLFARLGNGGKNNPSTLWYVTDRQGSVIDLVENNGDVEARLSFVGFPAIPYDPSKNEVQDRYQYTGREYDYVSKLQYNRARWFDPNSDRWIAEDPIGLRGGDYNLYRYAGNNPTGNTDPSGFYSWVDFVGSWDYVLGDYRTGWFAQTRNAGAGFSDTVSFGLTRGARQLAGYDDVVNTTSAAYNVGVVGGTAFHASYGNWWGVGYGASTLTVNYADWSIQNQQSSWALNTDAARWLRVAGLTGQAVTSVRGLAKPAGFLAGAVPGTGYGMLALGLGVLGFTGVQYHNADKTNWEAVDYAERLVPFTAGIATVFTPGAIRDFRSGLAAGDAWARNTFLPDFPELPVGPAPRTPLPTRAPHASTGRPPQSPLSRPFSTNLEPGTYVYVQDANGVVRVVPNAPGAHPTVLGGGRSAAAAAGELTVGSGGVITELNNISYTFQFGGDVLPQVAGALQREGATIAPNAIRPFTH